MKEKLLNEILNDLYNLQSQFNSDTGCIYLELSEIIEKYKKLKECEGEM